MAALGLSGAFSDLTVLSHATVMGDRFKHERSGCHYNQEGGVSVDFSEGHFIE